MVEGWVSSSQLGQGALAGRLGMLLAGGGCLPRGHTPARSGVPCKEHHLPTTTTTTHDPVRTFRKPACCSSCTKGACTRSCGDSSSSRAQRSNSFMMASTSWGGSLGPSGSGGAAADGSCLPARSLRWEQGSPGGMSVQSGPLQGPAALHARGYAHDAWRAGRHAAGRQLRRRSQADAARLLHQLKHRVAARHARGQLGQHVQRVRQVGRRHHRVHDAALLHQVQRKLRGQLVARARQHLQRATQRWQGMQCLVWVWRRVLKCAGQPPTSTEGAAWLRYRQARVGARAGGMPGEPQCGAATPRHQRSTSAICPPTLAR